MRWINFLVESNDRIYVVFPEVGKVRFRGVKGVAVFDLGLGMRTGECQKFVRDDPVEVAIFHSLVVLVFFHVKSGEVDEVVLKRLFQAVEAVEQREVVGAHAEGSIAEKNGLG